MTTIPASAFVNVTPSVLAAGGNALDLNGLLLSSSTRVPIGTVQSFPDTDAVISFFGATSTEAVLAADYFDGYDNSTAKPGALLIAQYPTSAVSAYLRSGPVSGFTLAQLQAMSGSIGITIDGSLKTASLNLSAATGFSSAASLVGSALGIHGPQVGAVTGSISGGTLTVSAVGAGVIQLGSVLSGTGVQTNTYVTSFLSGSGGVGTYGVSPSQIAGSQAITVYAPGVAYDSTWGSFVVNSGTVGTGSTITFGTGALATSLLMTSITGAILSQGTGAVASPSGFMNALIVQSENWALFTTTFDPDAGVGNTNKLLLAAWTSSKNNRFGYVPWDTDASPAASAPATSSLGYLVAQNNYSAVAPVWSPDASIAAFVLGIAASTDFPRADGRVTFAYRSGSGLQASVTDLTTMQNLMANNYNFYAAVGTANDTFVYFYPGSISGDFLWLDSFVNQVWLNNAFQLALLSLLTQAGSIPYNAAGYGQMEAALNDPINAALNFGAIRSGITLSSGQRAAINAAAGGVDAASTIERRGWYLQILTASAAVRQARGSPPATFWYTDGQSVQQINLSSVAIT